MAGTLLLVWLTRPFAVYPAGTCRMLGDLARGTFARNAGALARKTGEWNPDEAWRAMVELVSEELGVRPDEITRDARFVEDLNC